MYPNAAVLLVLILGSSTCFCENCPCTLSKSWNDIFLVFDGSNGFSQNEFSEIVGFFYYAASMLTIGQAQLFQSRVGIITYGDRANLIAALDKYNSTRNLIEDMDQVERTNTEGTNINGAIMIANDVYKGSAHRTASRKVLIIAASTYRKGGYPDPLVEANTFKDNGGIIIVVARSDRHAVLDLQQIASPGYLIDATKDVPSITQLTDLLCSANCFCPSPYSALSDTARGEPTDGCFFVSNQPEHQAYGKRRCADASSGILSVVPSPPQQVFLTRYFSSNTQIYVGLERSYATGQWIWADGTPFNGTINDSEGDCGTVTRLNGFITQFASVQCSSQQIYSCEVTPCSTEFPCSSVFLN